MPIARRAGVWAVGLFVGLLAVYQANRDIMPFNDALASMQLAESVLHERNLSLSATEMPSMFVWQWRGAPDRPITLNYLDAELRRQIQQGNLRPRDDAGHRDMIVPTRQPGVYACTFAAGASLVALPVFALANLWASPLCDHPVLFWFAAKLVASLCVAGSAVYVFLTAAQFVERKQALVIALAYGLGTCVWSTSSQALWQHGPTELFIAMGAYHLVRLRHGDWHAAALGLALGAATLCRPTSALIVLAVGAYLVIANRRQAFIFAAAGAPLALFLLAYNQHYWGSPLAFGQTEITNVAESKTGKPEIWQTPIPLGLAGLLVSPSRGLFVYSPFLLFAVAGYAQAWRSPRYAALRPLSLAITAIWLLESRHFDWWSGWSYGYRHIVDTVPMLVLGLIPQAEPLRRSRIWKSTFAILLVWSMMVQFLGAFAYDFRGWNGRTQYVATRADGCQMRTFDDQVVAAWARQPGIQITSEILNIDDPPNRHRLWSVTDNQIGYYLRHYLASRHVRKLTTRLMAFSAPVCLSDSYVELCRAQLASGDVDAARDSLRRAERYHRASAHLAEAYAAYCEATGDATGADHWRALAAKRRRYPLHQFAFVWTMDMSDLVHAADEAQSWRPTAAD